MVFGQHETDRGELPQVRGQVDWPTDTAATISLTLIGPPLRASSETTCTRVLIGERLEPRRVRAGGVPVEWFRILHRLSTISD